MSFSFTRERRHASRPYFTTTLYDDAEAIRRTCKFSTRQATINPIYIKLNASTYVVHNLTNPQLTCKWANARPMSNKTCIPCIVMIGCTCILKSDQTRIIAPHDCSKIPTTSTTLHSTYNAAILREFYDLANQSLQGDHLVSFEGLTAPQPLRLTVFRAT
jgi:hypothetical protein